MVRVELIVGVMTVTKQMAFRSLLQGWERRREGEVQCLVSFGPRESERQCFLLWLISGHSIIPGWFP